MLKHPDCPNGLDYKCFMDYKQGLHLSTYKPFRQCSSCLYLRSIENEVNRNINTRLRGRYRNC